ncbi:hypothetical protein HMPREF9141_2639 [Prevotella multiformis DSM 16608]|uniref:Uncharacterized protein n=1 Tax=Prevotella multiformis DSM 16608 TaxID=888743 RepID=F0FAM2_9BACT|nr:hypothetical protein HMPREF9141_2639 [Prevotella multiformis DSM 16608]
MRLYSEEHQLRTGPLLRIDRERRSVMAVAGLYLRKAGSKFIQIGDYV